MKPYLAWLAIVALAFGLVPRTSTETITEKKGEAFLLRAFEEAATNRTAIERAWKEVPEAERDGMQFLIENMPARDRRSLSAEYLLENVSLAYTSLRAAPWREKIPKEIFLNDILPYASVDESRDSWRQKMHDLAAPLVEGCKTPSEAAQRINQKLFPLTGVRYSTGRRRANQGPLETLETKIATCTGLSILLVDACRSVGIPARVVGTPLWFNKRGNHTWVEIWDDGWHFTGAAEPDPAGLDRGWFVHDASEAIKTEPQHAIYATSFARTGLSFPMVWARNSTFVAAVNVTDQYTPKQALSESDKVRLLVKVLDRPAGKRVAAKVTVLGTNDSALRLEGMSRDESADLNDILPFGVARNSKYAIRVEKDGREISKRFNSSTNAQELFVMTLLDTPLAVLPSQVCYVSRPTTESLKTREEERLKKAVTEFFDAPVEKQKSWRFAGGLERLLRKNEPAVRRAVWNAYREAPIHGLARQNFSSNQVSFENYLSPYTVKQVGARPTNGWALFIAMHGGGGTAKEVNDRQWKQMQGYYRDHPEAGGYLYVALRAPNDTWNGFYDTYVYPLVANLINQFLLFEEVNPNKIFIMGYSHGGYGAYAIGPKMPDRFAAIHASAAAATDGETTAKTLRNTIFTVMVGQKDTMYGRYERNVKFRDALEKLRGDRTDIYPAVVQIMEGMGHGGLPDRDKIFDMYPAVRNPVPAELTWLMTDDVIHDLFWLHCDAPGKEQEIDATLHGNQLTVTTTENVTRATVLLDERLVDFDEPIEIELNGKKLKSVKVRPSLRTLCETLLRRGDPELAFTAQLELELGK